VAFEAADAGVGAAGGAEALSEVVLLGKYALPPTTPMTSTTTAAATSVHGNALVSDWSVTGGADPDNSSGAATGARLPRGFFAGSFIVTGALCGITSGCESPGEWPVGGCHGVGAG
jgi:hypothetical protein